jgi:hypothetical protein
MVACQDRFHELNHERFRIRQPRAGVLIAAYLDGRPQIFHFDEAGESRLVGMFAFIGNGRVAAKTAFATAKKLQPLVDDATNFVTAFETTTETVEELDGPISPWQVMPDGATKVR